MNPSPANPQVAQPPLRAVHMSLFPTMGSLNEVVTLAESKLPIANSNELYSLLMTYHNTLLQELSKGASHDPIPRTVTDHHPRFS